MSGCCWYCRERQLVGAPGVGLCFRKPVVDPFVMVLVEAPCVGQVFARSRPGLGGVPMRSSPGGCRERALNSAGACRAVEAKNSMWHSHCCWLQSLTLQEHAVWLPFNQGSCGWCPGEGLGRFSARCPPLPPSGLCMRCDPVQPLPWARTSAPCAGAGLAVGAYQLCPLADPHNAGPQVASLLSLCHAGFPQVLRKSRGVESSCDS